MSTLLQSSVLHTWICLTDILIYDWQKQCIRARHTWPVLHSRHRLQLASQYHDMPLAVMKRLCVVVN